MTQPLRVIYAGTPDFACPPLHTLIAAGHQIIGVFTQPDRPAGRGRQLQASPVKQVALDAGLTVYQPQSLRNSELLPKLREQQPDLMVVAAYGLLLPQPWLDLPRHGCWNIHASLLPRWRGAAPIQRAIAAGDSQTGITLMQMEHGLDTGAMLLRAAVPISNDETAASLHDKLTALGADVLSQGLQRLCQNGPWPGEIQDEAQATYAPKLSKDEARIDWQLDATELERRIRAFNPYPVCWAELFDQRTRIWDAQVVAGQTGAAPGQILQDQHDRFVVACGNQALQLLEVQPPGKRRMPVRDWLNARRG